MKKRRNQVDINRHDRDLVHAAEKTHYSDWGDVAFMEERAQTLDGRKLLHEIRTRLYHAEEAKAGLL